MSENINNSQNINNNAYIYSNPELQRYDTDNDGMLSVFEIENIQDEEGIEMLSIDLSSAQTEENKDEQIQTLEAKLETVNNEQGFISSIWNGIKCFTGLGSSSDKCEQAIEQFKNGEISYEEADSIISGFSEKQKSSVNLIANIATGLAAVAVVGSAVMTGGLSLGVIAAAAGAGAATKAGLKFADRATNKVEGDALDGKQILKDSLSGAVDGAVSVATMGIGTAAVTGKTVAQQTLKQTVIEGAKAGAKAGAISGAITGASDYTIEAAVEEDVEFNLGDLAASTAINAAGGAAAGGALGGISSGIQYKGMQAKIASRQAHHENLSQDTIIELSDEAAKLNQTYSEHIDEAAAQIRNTFGDDVTLTGRPKSENSIFEKLASKFKKGKLSSTSTDACLDAIGDGYGTRIQMASLSQKQSKSIIEDTLQGSGISYEQFVKYLDGDLSSLDNTVIESIESVRNDVLNALKEAQTKDVFESLIEGIKRDDNGIIITELNNYGDDISSYFTPRQINEIAEAYFEKTGKRLDIVTRIDDSYKGSGSEIKIDDEGTTTITTDTSVIKNKGASKDSGYTSTQMNTRHPFNDGTTGNGELQIRGTEVNDFADVEHIPYDIKKDKIIASDTEYAPVYNLIKGLSDDAYKSYNTYLTKVYNWLRLKELGIETSEPVIKEIMSGYGLSDEALELLSREGLINFSNSIKH